MNDPRFKLVKDFYINKEINKLNKYETGIKLDTWHLNHYFHFIEVLLGIWAHSKKFKKIDIIFSSIKLDSHFEELLKVAFPNSIISYSDNFFIKNCIVVDRFAKVSNLEKINLNKMLENSINLCTQHFESFKKKVLDNYKFQSKKAPTTIEKLNLTYVMRNPPRTIKNVEKFFEFLNKKFRINPKCVWLEKMTIKDQILLMCNTDILVGVHGNGLTNLLWLPNTGAVIEIFGNYHHYDYQILSEISGVEYFGFLNDIKDRVIFKNGTRFKDAIGSTNQPVNNLKLEIFEMGLSGILKKMRLK